MELSFSYVALVLFVTITNAGIYVLGLDVEDLDAVVEEHAIVESVKLCALDLLYVAQELMLLPVCESHTAVRALFLEYAFQQVMLGESLEILPYPAELDFDALAVGMIKQVVPHVLALAQSFEFFDHDLGHGTKAPGIQREYAIA